MSTRFAAVRDTLRRAMDEGVFPCANLEIGDRHGALYRFSEGHCQLIPEPVAVTEDTVFDMASCTKVMATTMVALSLVERGRMALSDTMSLYYDGIPEAAGQITVYSLLTHTSGLPGGVSIVGWDSARIDEEILRMPLNYPMGSRVEYACLGFILLGRLLERVAGQKLDALAQELVFGPLSMTSTGYRPEGGDIAATGNEERAFGLVHDYNARYLQTPCGNAGLFSNLRDCARFAAMLLQGGVYQGERILARATLEAAARNHTPFSGEMRGLGFYRFNRPVNPVGELFSPEAFGHSGWTGTSIAVDPTLGLYAVLLTNRTLCVAQSDDAIWRVRRLVHNAAVAACGSI